MKFKLTALLLLTLLLFSCKEEPIEEYQIIPHPQVMLYTSGSYALKNGLVVAYPPALQKEAGLLKDYLASDFGLNAILSPEAAKGNITLSIDESAKREKPDGYVLDISSKGIRLTSNNATGVFNGIQSLRQIIKPRHDNSDKLKVQYGTISDYPAFGWRAFMLDEARHFKGKETVKQLMDEMARLKMNVFHWHLVDDQGWRIEIKKYPLLTQVGGTRDSTEINHFHSNVFDGKPHSGFYTQDDIREIVAYAADRHIQIVPEIEMPGHASAAIAAYPWLGTSGKQIRVPATFGVHYEVYNVTDPKVIQFFSDVMDEVIALFPSPYFHIGGDEVRYNQWHASPSVQAYMKKNGLKTPAELQVFFTNNISNLLTAKKRHMVGWNEITGAKLHEYQSEKDTEVKQRLADGTVVQFWKGDPKLMLTTIEKGYSIINSFHEYTYLDYSYESIPLSKSYAYNPVPEGLPEAQKDKVLGIGCQMWCEFIPTVESMQLKVFPRIAAYAENGWTLKDNKNYDRFKANLSNLLQRWDKEGIKYGPVD